MLLLGGIAAMLQATAQKPELLKNMNGISAGSISSNISDNGPYFTPLNNGKVFFFSENENTSHYVPHITDGTAKGTINLSEVITAPTFKHTQFFEPVSKKLYFSGAKRKTSNIAEDNELYITDGTVANTKLFKDIKPGVDGASVSALTQLGNKIFFIANETDEYGLYSTDGTAAGTVKLKSVYIAGGLVPYKGKLYFSVKETPSSNNGFQLWETDGTAAGTKMLHEVAFAKQILNVSVGANGIYLAVLSNPTAEMMRYDEKTKTTIKLQSSPKGYLSKIVTLKGKDYFVAEATGSAGKGALIVTDGTTAGTKELITPNTITASRFVAAETFLAFEANGGSNGRELWISDGTTAGTIEIDINKGANGSFASNLTRVGNNVYFSGDFNDGTGSIGSELMVTDGTAKGTKLIADIFTGPIGSSPTNMTYVNLGGIDHLLFTARSQSEGEEPYKLAIKVTSPTTEQDNATQPFKVFPNPSNGSLQIVPEQGANITNAYATVYNLQGQIVYHSNLTDATQRIQLQNVISGTYILKITGDNFEQHSKIIIE